ncbi:MAG: hypothetical protein FWD39_01435 [Clostridiales bacterium]|nr:hypothetical protein [Clostridiales bacterium]
MENGSAGFNVQYVRTDGWRAGAAYPAVTVVSSVAGLEEYAGFIDADGKYTDEFFLDNFLVIVLLEEGSGSTRHRVESVGADGRIVISRLLPEAGTCDMAEWNIVIELKNGFEPRRFRAVFLDKTNADML